MAKRKAETRVGDRHAGTAKTIRFTEEQAALLEAIKEKSGGSYSEAIAASARAYLQRNDLNADLALELRRLANELEKRK